MNSHPPIEPDLYSDLHAVISDSRTGEFDFNALAMRVFQHQLKHNNAYLNYCSLLDSSPNKDSSPNNIQHWHDIPAVPTDVFKLDDLPIISFPADEIRHTFSTSGTTRDVKGHHHFPSLTLYENSILSAWNQLELPPFRATQAIFLTPSAEHAPQSSLSHMMRTLEKKYATTSHWAIDDHGHLDHKIIVKTIKEAANSDQPVALLGTALAFLHLFEKLDHPITLPAGSWVLETGGYKGTRRQLEKAELYQLFHDQLGLEPDSIINEYSMTELSSQFYTRGLDAPHVGPSWTRIRVIDPLTEKDALPGEPGHLVIYDLANLHSVMAIRTQDLAISTGSNSFTLLGRDPSALPRGCSRAADDTLRS